MKGHKIMCEKSDCRKCAAEHICGNMKMETGHALQDSIEQDSYTAAKLMTDLLDAAKQAVCGNMGWKGKLQHAIDDTEKQYQR